MLGSVPSRGLCPRGARSWTLRFLNNGAARATETVSYRAGSGAARIVNVQPGESITIHLVPNAVRTHEPADRFVPRGQPRGLTGAMSVPTTAPLHARLYQATEPQTLRADVRLALTSIAAPGPECGLVESAVKAYTYPNSR